MCLLAVNVGSLQKIAEATGAPGFDFHAFQLPVASFRVTGVSRATALVADIVNGYSSGCS